MQVIFLSSNCPTLLGKHFQGQWWHQQRTAGEYPDSLQRVVRDYLLQQAAGGEDDQAGLLRVRLRQPGEAGHPRDSDRLPQADRDQVFRRKQRESDNSVMFDQK